MLHQETEQEIINQAFRNNKNKGLQTIVDEAALSLGYVEYWTGTESQMLTDELTARLRVSGDRKDLDTTTRASMLTSILRRVMDRE